MADVECLNESGQALKAWAIVGAVRGPNGERKLVRKFPTLRCEHEGVTWARLAGEDEGMPALTGEMLDGVWY